MKKLIVMVPEEMHEKIRTFAHQDRVSMGGWVREALDHRIEVCNAQNAKNTTDKP
jgi:predicted HicB family RNase H-like nuclease